MYIYGALAHYLSQSKDCKAKIGIKTKFFGINMDLIGYKASAKRFLVIMT